MTEERLREVLATLDAAGTAWPAVARALPETASIRRGRKQGEAWIRPAVFFAEEHDNYPDCPLVALRGEDGVWFRKGSRRP